MSRYRIRVNDEEEGTPHGLLLLAVGAIAGLAAGVYLSERYGGLAGVKSRLKSRFSGKGHPQEEYDEGDEDLEAEPFESANEELEERVLSAFTNDPTLRERAVDIGAVAEHTIELTGHVFTEREVDHAAVIARGVPGVEAVVNRLSVRQDEQAEDSDDELDEDPDEDSEEDDDAQYAESDWGDEDAADRTSARPTDTHMAQDSGTEPPQPSV
jgi:BON domain